MTIDEFEYHNKLLDRICDLYESGLEKEEVIATLREEGVDEDWIQEFFDEEPLI